MQCSEDYNKLQHGLIQDTLTMKSFMIYRLKATVCRHTNTAKAHRWSTRALQLVGYMSCGKKSTKTFLEKNLKNVLPSASTDARLKMEVQC